MIVYKKYNLGSPANPNHTRYVRVDTDKRTVHSIVISDETGLVIHNQYCKITKFEDKNKFMTTLPNVVEVPIALLYQIWYQTDDYDIQSEEGLTLGKHEDSTEQEFLTALGIL